MSQKHGVQKPNYKIIRIFVSQDSILFLTKEVKKSRGGEVLIFIKKNLCYKTWKDLSESDEHKEILSLEVSYKNLSNILLRCCYKPPKVDNDILSMFLKQVFKNVCFGKETLLSYWRSQFKLFRIFESFNFLQFTIWIWCNCFNK